CISVDPYYLTHKAQKAGYHPEIILAGRRINDGMGRYVAGQLIKAMIKKRIQIEGARVLILGLAFKENCPDLRNTRVVDIVGELQDYNITVDIHDPWIDADEAHLEYGFRLTNVPAVGAYDAIILAVAHREFKKMGPKAVTEFGKAEAIIYDLKYVFNPDGSDIRL
uniref:UDP binding domain-containing protein n=1 Tax=Rhizobium rhizoryzae TaxID=451876 RepID=UPI0028ACB98B